MKLDELSDRELLRLIYIYIRIIAMQIKINGWKVSILFGALLLLIIPTLPMLAGYLEHQVLPEWNKATEKQNAYSTVAVILYGIFSGIIGIMFIGIGLAGLAEEADEQKKDE